MSTMNFDILFRWKAGSGEPKPGEEEVSKVMHTRGLNAADYYWAYVDDGEGLHELVIWPREDGDYIRTMDVCAMSEKAHELYDIWFDGRIGNYHNADWDIEQAISARHNTDELTAYQKYKIEADMEERREDITTVGEHWDSEVIGEEIPEYKPPKG